MTGPIGIESHVGPPIGVAGDTQRYSLRLYGDGYGESPLSPVSVAPVSIACWFRVSDDFDSTGTIISIDSNSTGSFNLRVGLFSSGTRFVVAFRAGNMQFGAIEDAWEYRKWHFAAASMDSDGSWSLWVDSQKAEGAGATFTTNNFVLIGCRNSGGSLVELFKGNLRNCYIFDQVLSDSQVGELRSEQSPTGVTPVAHWPLSDGSGNEAEELIAGNNAALVNHAWSTDAPDILDL